MSMDSQSNRNATIYIVDDDQDICDSLSDIFEEESIRAIYYRSARSFLRSIPLIGIGCILLDVNLPEMSGLEIQEHLERVGNAMPIIFMTAYGDIPMTVKALKAGASDFLEKPFRLQVLLDAVSQALSKYSKRLALREEVDRVRGLASKLTPRESEVMKAVVAGKMNKQIAYDLNVQEITIKVHRASVMRKMKAKSLAELVRKVASIEKF
ncbi:response regulator transcription factor [Brucella haematophila]|uniref:response regulator transcription factor n=2 Tax=Brucella haematophila TaxID=419474 RepID=UPI00110DFF83|nr:response regulator transcription factor [Brucella haematophila]